jgi:aryl-alcohol dehydrogenase-like predicted oxidoreductase
MSAEDSSEMIDTCARQGIAFIPWGPLNLSNLADGGKALDQAAQNHNATRNQIVLAWLLQRSTSMLPIPGTSSVKHLEENTAAAEIKLSQAEFDAIKVA